MTTTDLCTALLRLAEACEAKSRIDGARDLTAWVEGLHGKAAAYRHAAELLRGAVAAAVEEERAACAALCEREASTLIVSGAVPSRERELRDDGRRFGAGQCCAAIRARGESPRGDAASDGREAP